MPPGELWVSGPGAHKTIFSRTQAGVSVSCQPPLWGPPDPGPGSVGCEGPALSTTGVCTLVLPPPHPPSLSGQLWLMMIYHVCLASIITTVSLGAETTPSGVLQVAMQLGMDGHGLQRNRDLSLYVSATHFQHKSTPPVITHIRLRLHHLCLHCTSTHHSSVTVALPVPTDELEGFARHRVNH